MNLQSSTSKESSDLSHSFRFNLRQQCSIFRGILDRLVQLTDNVQALHAPVQQGLTYDRRTRRELRHL